MLAHLSRCAAAARGRCRAASGAAALLVLAGCAGSIEPVRPCCYVGEIQIARLADVSYLLGDGESRRFVEVFPDFVPGGGFGRALPFRSAPIRLVTYDALEVTLPRYDANDNNQLEKQELTVLYLVELARGIGLDAESVGAGAPAGAIALSGVDEQGLANLVAARRKGLAAEQQAVFRELEWLGNDIRGRNPPFRETDGGRIWVPG